MRLRMLSKFIGLDKSESNLMNKLFLIKLERI